MKKIIKITAVALLISLAAGFVLLSFKNNRFMAKADEGYYLDYALSFKNCGFSWYRNFFKEYLSDSKHWLFPNPLRFGFIYISYLWMSIFGFNFNSLAYLSLFCYVLFLAGSFYFGYRYFKYKTAFLLTALLAFSPLAMAMGRRALSDSAGNLFLACSVWLFLRASEQEKNSKYILFILAYSIAMLIRESSVLFLPFFIGWNIFFRKKTAVLFIPAVLVAIVYVLLGATPYFFDTVKTIILSPRSNPYAIVFCSGPWFRYIVDYLLMSPATLILAMFFAGNYILKPGKDRVILYFFVFFIFTYIAFNFFAKNVRYVLILDIPIRLAALLMLEKIAGRFLPKYKTSALIVFVAFVIFFDCLSFSRLFSRHSIYDPASVFLLKATKFVP